MSLQFLCRAWRASGVPAVNPCERGVRMYMPWVWAKGPGHCSAGTQRTPPQLCARQSGTARWRLRCSAACSAPAAAAYVASQRWHGLLATQAGGPSAQRLTWLRGRAAENTRSRTGRAPRLRCGAGGWAGSSQAPPAPH
jgi:hypothetical protein